eukprot:comp16767_c0_seq1/m.15113 comp16767_c0_seq1/g.15113  ORF comp16767_c0_seq1/g.15113 comp16767_c0_seq1/m.15113 type:complete len:253 (-) comp16767_c0_seq1:50-808(-)
MAGVRISLTKGIAAFLKDGLQELDPKTQKEAKALGLVKGTGEPEKDAAVEYTLVRDAWKTLREKGKTQLYLHELLQGTGIYEEPYVPPPRNPELVARLEKLQAELAEKEYKRVTANVDRGVMYEQRRRDIHDIKSVKQQVMMMVNMLVSLVGVFFFIYYATAHLLDHHWRVLAGTLAGLLALVAEMWMYLRGDIYQTMLKPKEDPPQRVGPARPEDLEDIEPELLHRPIPGREKEQEGNGLKTKTKEQKKKD